MSKYPQSGQHPDADQISAFVDHALPPHEREEMLAHLADCTDCREIVALSLPQLVESPPAAIQKTRSWWFDFRFLLPAAAGAFAVLLLYVHHATNSLIAKRGPEIALQRPSAPPDDHKSSAAKAGGGAGSTTLRDRVPESPARAPSVRPPTPESSAAVAPNSLALDEAEKVVALHLPGGRIPISTVARGLQVLAIDDRNQLFLSNDRGVSWIAVRVPWQARAVKAELTSFPLRDAAGKKVAPAAEASPVAGFGSARGPEPPSPSDASQFAKQKALRQDLKSSYNPAAKAIDTPSAAPASALTSMAPGAPFTPGSVHGVITDRSGALIAGASVALTRQDDKSSSTAVTGSDGRYHVDGLAPGTYQLRARAPGFNATSISDIRLEPSSSTAQNLVLDVGAASQTVSVEANAPQLELSLPGLGQNAISGEQKSALPNALARLTPVFEITTDNGDHWFSSDGVNWQRR